MRNRPMARRHKAAARAVDVVTRGSSFRGDSGLRDQIRRSSTSVLANIAGGGERGGQGEYLQFLRIAKGSAGELRAQLYASEDLGYLARDSAAELRSQAAILSRQIASLIRQETESRR